MTLHYTPTKDGWLLVAAGSSALLYRADDASIAEPLWGALRSPAPVQSALDILTRDGLTATPAFALVAWSGGDESEAVVLVRGAGTSTAQTESGPKVLDGSTVSTWYEATIQGVSSVMLGSSAVDAPSLPIDSGIVWASSVTLGAASAVSVARPTPATAAVVAPPQAAPAKALHAVVTPLPAVPENTIAELSERDPQGYAHLFEETVVRSIEDAAVRPPEEDDAESESESESESEREPAAAPEQVPLAGDHDGMTIMSGDLAKLRRGRATAGPEAPEAPKAPSVFLELSTGGREALTSPILVGRSPSVTKVSSGQVPRLVTIPGDQDISRNHAQFTLEGDTVVVTDLHSRNGTSVILPGKSPQVLRPGEPTAVIGGTVVDLGGGVTLTVTEGA